MAPLAALSASRRRTRATKERRYRAYTTETLERALSAVIVDGHTVVDAAVAHGIPRRTLTRALRDGPSSRQDPHIVLSTEEERALVAFIADRAAHGLPISKAELGMRVKVFVHDGRNVEVTASGPADDLRAQADNLDATLRSVTFHPASGSGP